MNPSVMSEREKPNVFSVSWDARVLSLLLSLSCSLPSIADTAPEGSLPEDYQPVKGRRVGGDRERGPTAAADAHGVALPGCCVIIERWHGLLFPN